MNWYARAYIAPPAYRLVGVQQDNRQRALLPSAVRPIKQ